MSDKERKPLPPSPDVPGCDCSTSHEHTSAESSEGKKSEYKGHSPSREKHGHVDSEKAEGSKEEYHHHHKDKRH